MPPWDRRRGWARYTPGTPSWLCMPPCMPGCRCPVCVQPAPAQCVRYQRGHVRAGCVQFSTEVCPGLGCPVRLLSRLPENSPSCLPGTSRECQTNPTSEAPARNTFGNVKSLSPLMSHHVERHSMPRTVPLMLPRHPVQERAFLQE